MAYTSLRVRLCAANFLRQLDRRRSSLREEVEDDVAPVRGLTLEQRGKLLESVCRDAMAILRARPDFEQALNDHDPRSEEWDRLVERYRAHGRD